MANLKSKITLKFKNAFQRVRAGLNVMLSKQYVAITIIEVPKVNYLKAMVWDSGHIDKSFVDSVGLAAQVYITQKHLTTAGNNNLDFAKQILQCPIEKRPKLQINS